MEKKDVLKLDYFEDEIFEENQDHQYDKKVKSGSILAFPTDFHITPDGMFSNYESINGEPIRVRFFDDYVVLEPSGIKVPYSCVTPINWSLCSWIYDTKRAMQQVQDVEHVCFDTFFGRYCTDSKYYSLPVSQKDFKKQKKNLLENIKEESTEEQVSGFDYVCMFIHYLLEHGVTTIDIQLLNSLIYRLELLHQKEMKWSREEFFSQFASLMYTGVLYADYDIADKTSPKIFIDYTRLIDSFYPTTEETVINRFDDLIIDLNPESFAFIQERVNKNPNHYAKAASLGEEYCDIYQYLLMYDNDKEKDYFGYYYVKTMENEIRNFD